MASMTVGKIRLWVTVAMVVSLLVAGCHFASRNPPSTRTLQVPMSDVLTQNAITQSITLTVGNTLIVKLGSNYTTPYRWTPDMKVGDSAVVKQISHEFVQPSTDALGAPGAEVWTFEALQRGSTTLSASYNSIVGKDPKPSCTYTANVTVQ